MRNGGLGRTYRNGETIVQQGDLGNSMYVIQEGEVEVVRSQDGRAVRLAVLGSGEFFGEIAMFGNERRSATVRALGDARIITVDKKIFMRQVQADVSLAFRIFRTMAARMNSMNTELMLLKTPVC